MLKNRTGMFKSYRDQATNIITRITPMETDDILIRRHPFNPWLAFAA
jgi:hypothetical protein